ncbi:conserved exported hypothetical protein [Vibrio jasicida]|uniref:hypothetical protein n=1 Tax=Vibrio jasicida TaxID=766224 RepID=UPI002895935F|nr:conserved exported hypothetical protein [Vibrio jasicida]
MKKAICFLLSLLFTVPVWAEPIWQKSSLLESKIKEYKQLYTSSDLSDFDHKKMNQVDNLSFFIRYHDKPNTPEYERLKAYLWGMQVAYIESLSRQIDTNVVPWICPKGGKLKSYSKSSQNPTQFIESILWYGLEYDFKNNPERFEGYEKILPFAPSSSYISYGLRAKYPCYENSPKVKY